MLPTMQDPKHGKPSTAPSKSSTPRPSGKSSRKSAALKAISTEARDRLCAEWGGRKVYIPKQATPECALAKLIGLEAATVMVAQCAGLSIVIPTSGAKASRDRRAQVLELRRRGHLISDIVTITNLSERQVYKILSPE